MFNGCSSSVTIPDISKWNIDNYIKMQQISPSSFPDNSKWNYNVIKNQIIFPSISEATEPNFDSNNTNSSLIDSLSEINNNSSVDSEKNNTRNNINNIFDNYNSNENELNDYYDNFYQ